MESMTAGDPYEGLTDLEVFAKARDALAKAATLPPQSIERAIAWMSYDSAAMELDRRTVRHILAKIREDS